MSGVTLGFSVKLIVTVSRFSLIVSPTPSLIDVCRTASKFYECTNKILNVDNSKLVKCTKVND